MAKLTEDYDVVPPGAIYPVHLKKGDEVSGRLEEMARRDGKIVTGRASPSRKAHRTAPETK